MRDDRERLVDIIESIRRIEKYASRGRAAFDADELLQTWMVHHLQIIGEAARALSPQVKDANTDVPWDNIVGMRHILVHDYFGIDLDIVWSVVERELTPLGSAARRIVSTLMP